MMKKFLPVILLLIFITGCADNSQVLSDNRDFQEIVPEEKAAGDILYEAVIDPRIFQEVQALSPGAVDLDLTELSATMSYAAINNIMADPESNVGVTIKALGNYNAWHFDVTGMTYHFIIIEGPPGCCPKGMEFILQGEDISPDDYPPKDAKIEITGVFGSYDELGGIYYYLAVDSIRSR